MHSAKKLFWKNWVILLLGLFIVLLPFLGFPFSIAQWLFGIAGASIVVLSFLIGRGLSYLYSTPVAPPGLQSRPPVRKVPRPRSSKLKEQDIPVAPPVPPEEPPAPTETVFEVSPTDLPLESSPDVEQ